MSIISLIRPLVEGAVRSVNAPIQPSTSQPFTPEDLLNFINSQDDGALWNLSEPTTLFQTSAGSTPSILGDRLGRIEDTSNHNNNCTQATSGARPLVGEQFGVKMVKGDWVNGYISNWMAWPFSMVPGTFGFVSPFGAQVDYLEYGTPDLPSVWGMLMFFIPGDPLSTEDKANCLSALETHFSTYRDGVISRDEGLFVRTGTNTAPWTDSPTKDDFGAVVTLDFDSFGEVILPDDITGDYVGSPYYYGEVNAPKGDYFDLHVSVDEDLVFLPSLWGSQGQVFDLTNWPSLQAVSGGRSAFEGFVPQSVNPIILMQWHSSDFGNGKSGLVGQVPTNLGNIHTIFYSVYAQRLSGPFPDVSGCYQLQTLQLQHNVNMTGYVSPSLPSSLKYLGCYDTALTASERSTIIAHLRAAAITGAFIQIDLAGVTQQALDDVAWLTANGGNTIQDR